MSAYKIIGKQEILNAKPEFEEIINCYLVLKTVNRKPICPPKDSDLVTFRFLLTQTGFITYFIILT